MAKQFNGIINLDIRDSKPDWEPYQPPKAKDGAPNVLYIVWDDTGIGAWDIFGGLIEMPNMKRISDKGLRYSNWHTTAFSHPPVHACSQAVMLITTAWPVLLRARQAFPALALSFHLKTA